MKTKRLGIIGGAGPYASALLYLSLLDALYKQNKEIFEMVIFNYSFTRPHVKLSVQELDQKLEEELQECVDLLIKSGIEVAVIACNTLHAYLDHMRGGIRFIHLPQTVKKQIAKADVSKLLILGTPVTKKSGLYSDPAYFSVFPDDQEQEVVNRVITHILEGRPSIEDARCLEEVICGACQREGVDGVILGCTELPVLHARHPLEVPCQIFDSIGILAQHLSLVDV